MTDAPDGHFLDHLRDVLLDTSRRQLDSASRVMARLSSRQVDALANSVGRVLDRQSEAMLAAFDTLAERMASLEREIIALREGQASGERSRLQ